MCVIVVVSEEGVESVDGVFGSAVGALGRRSGCVSRGCVNSGGVCLKELLKMCSEVLRCGVRWPRWRWVGLLLGDVGLPVSSAGGYVIGSKLRSEYA